MVVGIATSGEGPNGIPKSRKGFGKLGPASLALGFANCQDVHPLVSQSIPGLSKSKMKIVYSGMTSCSPHLIFLTEPSTFCLKEHDVQYLN